jgi:c-di-GMP-binding flagellar brake protein YcgR
MSDILKHITGDNFIEHRKTARLNIPIKVQYKVSGQRAVDGDEKCETKAAMTKDISAGGCLLQVTEDLALNSIIEIEIFLGENESESLRLTGKIVRLNRAENGLYEYGISFADMGKDARRLFADYCFARMYEMIGLSEWPTDKSGKRA